MFENLDNNFFLSPWALSDDKQTLIYKPTADLLEKYRTIFKTIFPNINTDPTTPQGQIITALTEQDTNDLSLIADMANSFFLGGNGAWLDDWAMMMFRLSRKDGTPSSVIVDVEGSPRATITDGFLVSDGNLDYEFKGTYIIPDNGKGQITCICTTITEEESKAGSVVNIVTPLQGIYRVSNPNNSTPAILVENDSDFVKRCLKYGTAFRNTSIASIASEVMNLKGVIKVNAWDNSSKNEVTFKGTQFDPNSFAVVVLGGDDKEIAQALQNTKPPCTAIMGDVEVSLPNQNERYANRPDYNITYKFFRPTNIPLKFEVVVKLENRSPNNYKQIVQEAISDYVNAVAIGGDVNLSEASCAILRYSNASFPIKSIKMAKKEGTLGLDPISLDFKELATIALDDIMVAT